MRPITLNQARDRQCPFTFGGQYPATRCLADSCMAWRTIHGATSCEDHSGGRDMIVDHAMKTGRIARREGGPMSSGRWVVDEVGMCARLEAQAAPEAAQ